LIERMVKVGIERKSIGRDSGNYIERIDGGTEGGVEERV
jgi:hypothetical protein